MKIRISRKRLVILISVCVIAVAAIASTIVILIQHRKNQIPDQVPAIKPGEAVTVRPSDESDDETETGYEDIQKSDGLKYELNSDGNSYIVTGIGSCMDKDIVIPEEYKGKSVVAIGDGAFAGVSIETITFSNCIKSIGAKVFVGCNKLEIFFYGTKSEWINNIAKSEDWDDQCNYRIWPTEKKPDNWEIPIH